jgi:hypothetical protein
MGHARILTRRSSASSRLVDQSANHNSREELVRIEPDLAKGDLLELLHDRYGLDVSALTFVPYGIDSWSYAADCADGRRAFASSRDPALRGPGDRKRHCWRCWRPVVSPFLGRSRITMAAS